MITKPSLKLTQKLVKEVLDYNPSTGALTWRPRSRKWFDSDGKYQRWNKRFAGKPLSPVRSKVEPFKPSCLAKAFTHIALSGFG